MTKLLDDKTIKYIALSVGVKPKKDRETGIEEIDESIYALVHAIERHYNISNNEDSVNFLTSAQRWQLLGNMRPVKLPK